MNIILDPRLEKAAELVRLGAIAADIGTDHGYLICSLVASGKCPKGYACDINHSPLSVAAKNIALYGLEGKIETILTDGLAGLEEKSPTSIIILGMGGDLIGEIIAAAPWVKNEKTQLILQPMTKADHLRRSLYASGFEIVSESAVEAGRFVYSIFSVEYTGKIAAVDDLFALTGLLWYNCDNASRLYLSRTADRLQKKADGLVRAGQDKNAQKYREIINKIRQKANA